jgi:hypothetical protein
VNDRKVVDGVETITLPCCACDGKVSFATPETTTNPTFFHTIPYCKRFDDTNTTDDVVQYLRDCGNAQRN